MFWFFSLIGFCVFLAIMSDLRFLAFVFFLSLFFSFTPLQVTKSPTAMACDMSWRPFFFVTFFFSSLDVLIVLTYLFKMAANLVKIWTRSHNNNWSKWPDYPQATTLEILRLDFFHYFDVLGTFRTIALDQNGEADIALATTLQDLRNNTFAFRNPNGNVVCLVRIV